MTTLLIVGPRPEAGINGVDTFPFASSESLSSPAVRAVIRGRAGEGPALGNDRRMRINARPSDLTVA